MIKVFLLLTLRPLEKFPSASTSHDKRHFNNKVCLKKIINYKLLYLKGIFQKRIYKIIFYLIVKQN